MIRHGLIVLAFFGSLYAALAPATPADVRGWMIFNVVYTLRYFKEAR